MEAFIGQDVFEVESKVQELNKTDFPPLSRSSLSFFDDFHISSGIPVFQLIPTKWRDPNEVKQLNLSSIWKRSASSPDTIDWDAMFKTQCQITCIVFSPDSTLLVSGHHDGSIMVWDAEHGTLKRLIKDIHSVQVADLAFYSDSSRILLACDFSGLMSIHDVQDSSNESILVNCEENWERTRMPSVEGEWPRLCRQGKLLIFPVQVVIENHRNRYQKGGELTSTRLFSPYNYGLFGLSNATAYDSMPAKTGMEFSQFCILHIFDTRDEEFIVRNSVYGDSEGKAYNWGARVDLQSTQKLYIPVKKDSHDYTICSMEISHNGRGLLVGVNSRPQGHMIVWPDFRDKPLHSYRLEDMVGRWSPCDSMIVSWEVPIESPPDLELGACHLWHTETLLTSTKQCLQNSKVDHPLYVGTPSWTWRCPSGNPIYWCDFILMSSDVTGIASCSVGIEVQIVFWDLKNGVPVQIFNTGIKEIDLKLGSRKAWAEKWVSSQPSWGLNPISTSPNENRLGIFSLAANKGIIWDTEKRIQKLWFSVSNEMNSVVDPELIKEMDFYLSPNGEKFVTVNEDSMMIWCPQQLHRKEHQGSNWVSLSSSEPGLSGEKLRCKFSQNGDFVGLMRLFCTVMDVWDLSNGVHHVLRLPQAKKPMFEDSEVEETDGSNHSTQHLVKLNTETQEELIFADKSTGFCQFCISENGTRVVSCMNDNSVLLWQLHSKHQMPIKITTLFSRYYSPWDICFCSGYPSLIVACEDTGHLVWIDFSSQSIMIDRKPAGGTKRCSFSSDGHRAVLMPDDKQVKVWDLVHRQLLFQCTYQIWLGKSGLINFPHNISSDGKCALMGLDSNGNSVLCQPSTTYYDVRNQSIESQLVATPNHLRVTDDLSWFVTDRFRSFRFSDSSSQLTPESVDQYPDIRDRLADEYLWNYLRYQTPSHTSPSFNQENTRLIIRSVTGNHTEKQLVFPGLCPEKFIEISQDGRRIACIGGTGGNELQVWTANAADGCIPTTLSLLHFAETDGSYLIHQLDQFGPGILNQQDHAGLTLTLTAIYNKDVDLLRSLFSWAKEKDLKISLKDEMTDQKENEQQILNGLNLALGFRYPEVTRLILKYLLDGVCTEKETSEVLQDSLIRLSGVYPSILLKILSSNKVLLNLGELTVPEWAFAKSEYKVTASDELIPTTDNLYKMWVTERLEKKDKLFRKSEFKRTSANACVMPYPDIAQIGMNGIISPLLFNRTPHHVFATWPIRCVVKYKWKLYGKRLVIEDFVHYAFLLFFFTLYTLLIAFLVENEITDSTDNGFYRTRTSLVLIISVALALVSLIRKFLQIRQLWRNKKWIGVLYWWSDYWNVLELACYCLIVFLIPFAYRRSVTSRVLAGALACSCILLWCKTLYYAQAFKSTGPLVNMIREIMKDIRFYIFLMFSMLMGFTIAFFVLFRNIRFERCNERVDAESCRETQEDVAELFGTFDRTLVTMFSMILGEVSDVASVLFKIDEGLKFIGIVMFIFYLLTVTIVLLNLLIAIMGDGFDRVKATDMTYFLSKRAQIIDDMELMLTKARSEALSKKITKYIHVLLPKYKSDTQLQTSEWQGRMRDTQDRFRREVMKMFNQFSGHLSTVTENQKLLGKRIDELMKGLSDPAQLQRMSTTLRKRVSERRGTELQTLQADGSSDIDDIFEKESLPDTI
eukprot:g4505.t1